MSKVSLYNSTYKWYYLQYVFQTSKMFPNINDLQIKYVCLENMSHFKTFKKDTYNILMFKVERLRRDFIDNKNKKSYQIKFALDNVNKVLYLNDTIDYFEQQRYF